MSESPSPPLRLAGADGPDLVTSLERYVRGCERHSGQRYKLQSPPERRLGLSEDAEIQAMRIIQEALTTPASMPAPTTSALWIRPARAEVVIDVEDEGCGFTPAGPRDDLHRFGLRTMSERAGLVGGTVEVRSRPGEGTRVRLRLPRVAAPAAPAGSEEIE